MIRRSVWLSIQMNFAIFHPKGVPVSEEKAVGI